MPMFALKLLIVFGKFVVIAVVLGLVLYGSIFFLNRLIQLIADSLGYEVGDFFEWLRDKLPKRKEKKDG